MLLPVLYEMPTMRRVNVFNGLQQGFIQKQTQTANAFPPSFFKSNSSYWVMNMSIYIPIFQSCKITANLYT